MAVTKPSLAEGQTVKQAESYKTRERLRRLIEEDACSDWTTGAVFSPGQSAFQLFEPLIDLRPA